MSRERLEHELGGSVDSFCWVGGEEWSYGRKAAHAILQAGYRYAFMTNVSIVRPATDPLWLNRTNIESSWPLDRVRFYLSGVMDVFYTRKRKRVSRKLGENVA